MNANNHFVYLPVTSSISENKDFVDGLLDLYKNPLSKIGGSLCSSKENGKSGLLFYFLLTGGTEKITLELISERQKNFPKKPVFLLSHPGNNSLPSALEILAKLNQEKIEGKIYYLNGPDDGEGINKIASVVVDYGLCAQLENTKIGTVGEPSEWLIASSPDSSLIRKTWGPEIIHIEMKELMDLYKSSLFEETSAEHQSLAAGANDIIEPSQNDIKQSGYVLDILRKLINKYELDALTLRCFDLITDIKTTGCFALAQLNDEGIIAGCEGDLVSTLGMIWSHKLFDEIPWMANPAHINEAENRLLLAHCTVPRNLVTDYKLRSHFESGLGLGIEGNIPAGPVTIFRIGGKHLDKLWASEGEIISQGNSEHLCRTQIEIQLMRGGQARDLLTNPLGNHLIMIKGHQLNRLEESWKNIMSQNGISKDIQQN